jgi:lipopolysaccharide cholinephosphotransferase
MRKVKFFVILAILVVVSTLSYRYYAREQLLSFFNNTKYGQSCLVILKKYNIYDHEKKIKSMRPEYAVALYQMMQDVHQVLEVCEIPYWIDGGTLLGAIRHKGIIPWDDDLDIQISGENQETYINKALPIIRKLGYETPGGGCKILTSEKMFKTDPSENPPSCDVFVARKINGRLDINWPHAIQISDWLPLKKYKFGTIEVWGCNNPTPYLNDLYGKNWNVQAWRGYDHLSKVDGKESSMVPFAMENTSYKPAEPFGPLKDNKALINTFAKEA